MPDCLFCKIVSKEIDADVVHESSEVLAFKDINPAAPTHVLVIPKLHLTSAKELSSERAELLGHLFDAVNAVVAWADLEPGWRLVTNVGADGGQTVGHLHFHVMGGRRMAWPPG